MNMQETVELLLLVKTAYRRWFDGSKEEFSRMAEVWHNGLKDVPFDIAKNAFTEFSRDSQYPPTIADIYKPYKELQEQQKELLLEYNNIYYSAIAHYPGYKDSEAERKEFDRITGYNRSKAIKLSNKLIDYVKSCELSEEYIPPLEEWLKEIDSID